MNSFTMTSRDGKRSAQGTLANTLHPHLKWEVTLTKRTRTRSETRSQRVATKTEARAVAREWVQ